MKLALLSLLVLIPFSQANAGEAGKRILFGVSNVADMGDPDKMEAKNNLWEVAPAYHAFVMHGYEVDFVSPEGGKVPFSFEVEERDPPGMIAYTIRYEGFREKTDNTMTPDEVDPSLYTGYFVAGGTGPLFDLARSAPILGIAGTIYENGGILGGCGHGPGSIANVRLSGGSYAVAGKRVTGFPNSTEYSSRWSKNGTLLPFTVENELRARGGNFQTKEDLADKYDIVVDGRIATTMFLSSCAIAAQHLVDILEE